MSATILVVEDAPEMMALVSSALQSERFAVVGADSRAELEAALAKSWPDLILLDVNLPDADGLELACALKLREKAGLIFVTGRDAPADRLKGLEAGGDDYVTKPFEMRELIARIRNVLRLRQASPSLVRFGDWSLDMVRRELYQPPGTLLPLTNGEFNILAALASARPHPLTRDFLLDVISNRDPSAVRPHTVDTLIARLRRKLGSGTDGAPSIVTVRGIGYALVANDEAIVGPSA